MFKFIYVPAAVGIVCATEYCFLSGIRGNKKKYLHYNRDWLQTWSKTYARDAAEWKERTSDMSYEYKYYSGMSSRCKEELEKQHHWETQRSWLFQTFFGPPSIDHMYIEFGKRY